MRKRKGWLPVVMSAEGPAEAPVTEDPTMSEELRSTFVGRHTLKQWRKLTSP